MTSLQKEVERCMHATAGHGVAKVLFYELVGWGLETRYALDERILRDCWRFVTC